MEWRYSNKMFAEQQAHRQSCCRVQWKEGILVL